MWVYLCHSCEYACHSDAAAPPCQHAMDVGIIMDRSGSVGSKDFLKSKNFVSALARKFQISSRGTRVGIIAYHSSSHLVVKFAQEDKQNPSAMKDVIDRYHYFQGHPTTVFCKISVRRSKYCLTFSITRGRLKIYTWLFHSCTIFEAYLINSLRFSEV